MANQASWVDFGLWQTVIFIPELWSGSTGLAEGTVLQCKW